MKKLILSILFIIFISSVNAYYCYQENASTNTECANQVMGNYSVSGYAWTNPANGFDNNWATSAGSSGSGVSILQITYSKPINATNNVTWQVKDAGATRNITFIGINASCINSDPNYITFRVEGGLNDVYKCWNGTTFHELMTIASTAFYEEALWWDINSTGPPFMISPCGGIFNRSVINLSFADESTSVSVNASLNLNLKYWRDNKLLNQTYQENLGLERQTYSYCSTNQTTQINGDISAYYSSTGYPQRQYISDYINLTNFQSKTLYLLSSTDGQYVTFQVINAAEQPLENVISNVSKSGQFISSGKTDASGGITYWLNPDDLHSFNFYLSPYPLYATSLAPTQSSYTITLGSSSDANVSDYHKGITYSLKPSSYYLWNGSTYSFNFTISSSFWNLESYGFIIYNQSGTILGSNSSNVSTGSTVMLNLFTGNNKSIYVNYFWEVNGSSTTAYRNYLIVSNVSNYGLNKLVGDFKDYTNLGLFGLDDFGKGLIIFLLIVTFTGVIRIKYGVSDETTIIGVIFALVALFDVGFNLIPNPIGAVNNFPTILMVVIFLGFIWRESFQ